MLSSKSWPALVVFFWISVEASALAAGAGQGNDPGQPAAEPGGAASEAEMARLRQEVAELRALLQQLLKANGKDEPPTLAQNDAASATRAEVDELKDSLKLVVAVRPAAGDV